MSAPIVAAVVLAAGGGRRYGMPKALVEYEGSLLVERAVRTARAVCDPVLVVLGAQAVDVWRQADLGGAAVLANKDWETGMASSLRTGLDGLRGWPDQVDAALITLVDMPGMTPAALAAVRHDGARTRWPSPPTTASAGIRCCWAGPLGRRDRDATGDEGARRYLAEHDVTEVDCTGLADPTDLDVPPSGVPSAP